MSYRLVFSRSVLHDFKKLPAGIKKRVTLFLPSLERSPYPSSCKKLSGHDKLYRVRFGEFRLLYEVHRKKREIHLLKCLHRRDVYR